VDLLPDDKPRFIHGIGSPEEVVSAVECGIDIFDSSYPLILYFHWQIILSFW